MSYSLISLVPMLLASFAIITLNIVSAVVLLRERHLGAWLMMAGGVTMLVSPISHLVYPISALRRGIPGPEIMIAISLLATLGSLLFAMGLLLHALHQRAKANRITELEAIIASLQNR